MASLRRVVDRPTVEFQTGLMQALHQRCPGDSWPLGNSSTHRSPKEVWENNAEISGSLGKCFTPDLFTARAKAWIAEHNTNDPDQPFFLYLAFRSEWQPLSGFDPSSGKAEITFTRRMDGSHDLTYTVQASRDLIDWETLTTSEVTTSVLSAAECLEQVTFEADASSLVEPRQILRVKVEIASGE